MANLPDRALRQHSGTRAPLTVHPRGGPPSPVGLIGHAGLALQRLHGTPTTEHLELACRLDLTRLEVDLCNTLDGHVVLRHDVLVERGNVARPEFLGSDYPVGQGPRTVASAPRSTALGRGIPERTAVSQLTLAELRTLDPETLTLDNALSVLSGRLPLLLDIKADSAAPVVGRWLSRRPDAAAFAVCTESVGALLTVRFRAPRAERWPSFPDIGSDHRTHLARVLAELWRGHRELRHARRSLVDLQRALLDARSRPHQSLANLAGLPWRSRMPEEVLLRSREVRAAGLCVHHWLINPDLCQTAAALGLPITAWTVNNPEVARRVAECGVDMITTDKVDLVRRSVSGVGPRSVAGGRALPAS